ncbi:MULTISPECIES: 5-carboxymethyl-2-hydroxymuconate Delta-isomerase [Mameliella]|uniref:5-carboxymethyl-2-hydroxymuconate isomerase n=1 Tax=Mameliella alba TaxID=561184 RepID=A0A0B3S613_9RHOB|nr:MULTISPECIES: 5-carboxymethyl-2-hydroxymuconate Delta-isomerase [Mameliella]ODM48893.1 5-carboxymethyl-2-hydroxymuconate isomerase [Ruegeria sp. PBVC088]KHQ54403.1 5-carboxymethyl-2-hydroxymuconate isomerase [Mameliella alba]MBY6118441.1 5-carboxymethyl-2-hydroxymuconate Delta-isomerase [Mameliella alba]MDD9730701.1 5-carboxymethyl-2-hydroxymuconate Delta-isomerase [Mameliella sp. AT18]OWV43290.1 5-carboxymethyl-2-hydroxymuconate isomerase [Mameliella alba]
MPHLKLEYSPGLEALANIQALCDVLHAAMSAAGVFPLAGIRVRAHRCDAASVADRHPDNHFLAMELSVGAGRSKPVLAEAGEAVFAVARDTLADLLDSPHFALSLEIREIDPDLSWKANPIHARLKAES